jgi:cytochrome c biogenesis protein CcdA
MAGEEAGMTRVIMCASILGIACVFMLVLLITLNMSGLVHTWDLAVSVVALTGIVAVGIAMFLFIAVIIKEEW